MTLFPTSLAQFSAVTSNSDSIVDAVNPEGADFEKCLRFFCRNSPTENWLSKHPEVNVGDTVGRQSTKNDIPGWITYTTGLSTDHN
jgi:hypothetical protein